MANKVYLVGAGPGDIGLLTIRAYNLIKKAKVIVYDRLVSEEILELNKSAKFIDVGKKPDEHKKTQEQINEILYLESRGNNVVRLKGGDPYVFGRGSEEAQYLIQRGVKVEVVNGITSAIAGLNYAGIPITARNIATSFHVITGHLSDGKYNEFEKYAKLNGTLVFLMGIKNIELIVEGLVINGKSPKTPVAVINWATRNYQRKLISTLENVSDDIKKNSISNPSLIVVGDVVNFNDELDFFSKRELFGKRIVTTRAVGQFGSINNELSKLGAIVTNVPVIEFELIEDNSLIEELNKKNEYEAIIFTSQNTVKFFFDELYKNNLDARFLNFKIIAIGNKTSEVLEDYGVKSDFVSKGVTSKVLKEELLKMCIEGKILYPKSSLARNPITEEESLNITTLDLYHTKLPKLDVNEYISDIEKSKSIVFCSASQVRNFIKLFGKKILENMNIYSIGNMTTKEIIKSGLKIFAQASKPSIKKLIEEIRNGEKCKDQED